MKNIALVATVVVLGSLSAACADTAASDSQSTGSQPADSQSESQSESAKSDGATVMVQNIAFKPEELKVLRGTEVTWKSADEGVRHTATSGKPGERAIAGVQEGSDPKPDGVFDGDMADAGSEFSFTFDEAGTYSYFCDVHPSMTGEIVVD